MFCYFLTTALSSSFNRLSCFPVFVKHFFLFFYFSFSRSFLSCCLSQTASIYYHVNRRMSTPFFNFFHFCNYSAMRPQRQKPGASLLAEAILSLRTYALKELLHIRMFFCVGRPFFFALSIWIPILHKACPIIQHFCT